MLRAKAVLWSCAAIMPLLGFGAWYGSSAQCWPGCCEVNAAGLGASLSGAKVASTCCPDGPCCPECCTPDCCVGVKVASGKEKLTSTTACCSDGDCSTTSTTKVAAAFVCPITGKELPCPLCCPLNQKK
jgi:hypothetical protein